MYENELGAVAPGEEIAEAMHVMAVHEMHAANDEDKCTSCGVNPVWVGTMCQQCAEQPNRPVPPAPPRRKPKGR